MQFQSNLYNASVSQIVSNNLSTLEFQKVKKDDYLCSPLKLDNKIHRQERNSESKDKYNINVTDEDGLNYSKKQKKISDPFSQSPNDLFSSPEVDLESQKLKSRNQFTGGTQLFDLILTTGVAQDTQRSSNRNELKNTLQFLKFNTKQTHGDIETEPNSQTITPIPVKQKQSSQIRTNQYAQDYEQCRFCHSMDKIQNLIRPCLCKGSIQYTHQICIEKTIEQTYMDESKNYFKRDLECQFCKFQFVINTYYHYSISQVLQDYDKRVSFFYLFLGLIFSIASTGAISLYLSLHSNKFTILTHEIFLYVTGCVISCVLVVVFSSKIIQSMQIFEWKVEDRNENYQYQEPYQKEILSSLIKYFREKKRNSIKQ